MKGEHFESIKNQIKEAGFDVAKAIESDDGSVIFKQGDTVDGEGTVIRMSDSVAIVTKGFSPYNMDVSQGDQSFADMCQARGFYPGVSTIMETLAESVRDAVAKADSSDKAKTSITKLFTEAQAYTAAFVAGLPQKAFKLESIAPEIPNGDGATNEDNGTEDKDANVAKGESSEDSTGTTDEGTATTQETKLANDGVAGDAGTGSGEAEGQSGEAALTEEQVSSIVSTQVTKAMDALAEKLGAFTAGVEAIQKSVGDMSGNLEKLQGRMDEAEKVAKSAKDAVTGTVVIGSETGDHNPTKKSESSGFGGREIDTAYNPGVRSRGRASR